MSALENSSQVYVLTSIIPKGGAYSRAWSSTATTESSYNRCCKPQTTEEHGADGFMHGHAGEAARAGARWWGHRGLVAGPMWPGGGATVA